MRGIKLNTHWGLLAAGAILFGSGAQAASINYGNFAAPTANYLGVTESSGTDPVPLYGAPAIEGNVLDFDPIAFTANTANGGADITDGQLNFTIQSTQGNSFLNLLFTEYGDYTLAGVGSLATSAGAGLTVQVKILAVDGVALATPITKVGTSQQNFALPANIGVGTPWYNSVSIDLAAALAAKSIAYLQGVTKVEVVLNDTLIATSQQGTIAFIAKKDFVVITDVPEPGTIALLVGGAGLICLRRRKA